jgi:subtilisin family serine protease
MTVAAMAAVFAVVAPAASAAPSGVLVRFAKSADASDRQAARQDAGTTLDEVLPLPRLQLVDPEPGVSVGEAIDRLNGSPDVLYAEPDRTRHASVVPNDDFFGDEWGLNNTGQDVNGTAGSPDADIDAPEAWDVSTGSQALTVAVIDSGMDSSLADLAPNRWTNPGESGAAATNGLDDDGDGVVDDTHGWDFVGNDNAPTDGNGHGTHVSGTIGARGNDGAGVAGVNWNVSLAPVRVLNNSGSGTVSNVIKAYDYVGAKGIRVANASLGGTSSSRAECEAIAAAPNTLFVVAAGNDGTNNDINAPATCAGYDPPRSGAYPCGYNLPNVVCVAATDQNDVLASFSNFGATSVDLAAPGVDIVSTWPSARCSGDFGVSPPCWAYLNGTSMATPHVTGVAALVLAAHPGDSVADLRQALLSSVDLKPALAGKTVTGGRLNAFAALTGAPPSSGAGGGPPAGAAPAGNSAPAAPAPAAAKAPSARSDTAPPSIRLSVGRQTLKSVLRRGLRVKVRSSEAARFRYDLLVGSRTAAGRRVRAARSLLVGRARGAVSKAGSLTRPVALSARARRALRSLRGARLSLRVRAVDRKGNARTVSLAVVLR